MEHFYHVWQEKQSVSGGNIGGKMVVKLHRGQMRWFRVKAKAAYPLEIIALLVGKRLSPQAVGVSYFSYPSPIQGYNRVEINQETYDYRVAPRGKP